MSYQNFKLVVCDVRDGNLVSQAEPTIPGVEWVEIPDTRIEAGSYYQTLLAGRVPESECKNLLEHCSVDTRFVHVTKLDVNCQDGKRVLDVYYQEEELHYVTRL